MEEENDRRKNLKELFNRSPHFLQVLIINLELIYKSLEEQNPLFIKDKDICQYIKEILRALPDFFEDESLKKAILKYEYLFQYAVQTGKRRIFMYAFCISIFNDGLSSFFSGFGGFYGEDISSQMASHSNISNLNRALIAKKRSIIVNFSPQRKLSYYLGIKLLAENYSTLAKRQADNLIYRESWAKKPKPDVLEEDPQNINPFVSGLKIQIP